MSMSIGALRGVGDRRGTVDHGLARRMLVNEYKRGRHGRCVSTAKELAMLNRRRDELSAYVVEACVGCHWHHLRKVIPLGGSNGKSPPFSSS
jgi:hypothetical protein